MALPSTSDEIAALLRALVTGAAGFIGSNLCLRLVAEGHKVRGLDDLSEGSLSNLSEAPEVDLVVGDLRDEAVVRRAARGCKVIFHQGAVRSVPRSMIDPGHTMEVNLVGTFNVLQAAREERSQVVLASSSSVYGDQDESPLHEAMAPRPRSPYAGSKLMGEIYLQSWWRSFAVRTVALRYFNVYGPRQDPTSEYAAVVPKFILACLFGGTVEIHGDGWQARDFTYIDDVVSANILAAGAPSQAWGKAFNVGGGNEPTSINGLLEIIAQITGSSPNPVHTPPRAGDVRRTHADLRQANGVLGYKGNTAIEIGLGKTVDWFRSNSSAQSGRSYEPFTG